jgi:ATP-dependent Lon protease
MERARKCLAEAIYGQEEAKIQILQFIASKIANPDARGLSLMLAGPPGIGKTSLIKNGIAKALEWPFQFISLGGDSDASTYVGHQLVYEGSHCGKIVNSLVSAKSMSMILMFDELDKVSATPKGEEVQHLLVHLTDPVQNGDFEDKYLSGIPLDLSKVLFTFSANDLGKIDRVLMDRMVVIELQGYSAKEKLTIAETFLLPAALKEVNLDEKVSISHDVVEHILKEYAGDEKGVRELKRCVEAVVQKINMLRIFNTKELPFHIPGFQLPFVVKRQHIDLFLKKKNRDDESVRRMYI